MGLKADDGGRPMSRVATDQLHVVTSGQIKQTPTKPLQPNFVDLGKSQRQRCPSGKRAHRRQIAQIDRQRFVAKPFWVSRGKEMHIRYQRVQCHH